MLYGADNRLGCFLETLDHFTPELDLLQYLPEHVPEGHVSAQWPNRRFIGQFKVSGPTQFLDLRSVETRRWLRRRLAETLSSLGVATVDSSVIASSDRRISQAIGRLAYREGFGGVVYTCRHDDGIECWAVFEGTQVRQVASATKLTEDDPDLIQAIEFLGLILHELLVDTYKGPAWRIHRQRFGPLDFGGSRRFPGRYHTGWPALYLALSAEAAKAELAKSLDLVSFQGAGFPRPTDLCISKLSVTLPRVLDVRSIDPLAVDARQIASHDYSPSQRLAAEATALEYQALRARTRMPEGGEMLVVFPDRVPGLEKQVRVESRRPLTP